MPTLRTRLARLEQTIPTNPVSDWRVASIAAAKSLMADPEAYAMALELADRMHDRRKTESDAAILASDPELMGLAVAFAKRRGLGRAGDASN